MTRRYEQYCAVAKALDVVGDRWALLVVRELLAGPKRFSDLAIGLPGIATNVLTDRLTALQDNAVVTRRELDPPAARSVYELTPWGRDLKPVLLALAGWGTPLLGSPTPKETYSLSWLALSLEAHFDPDASVDEVIEFRVEGETIHAIVKDGTITIRAGNAADPSITLESSRNVFLAWGTGHISAKEATASGLNVLGTNRPLTRLARMFSLAA